MSVTSAASGQIAASAPAGGFPPATGRGLSGALSVTLDVLDAFQVLSALEYREGYLTGMARELRDHRMALGIEAPHESEAALATAIVQVRRAKRAIDEALGWAGTPDPAGGE